jgi:hypothetical protein
MIKALLVVALALVALRATPSDATPTVLYADGRISVDLRDADLDEVLGEVTKQAKLEVRGTPTAQKLSIRLEAVPLVDALERLLQGQSFVLTYEAAGGLKGVRFLRSSTEPWSGAASDTAAATPKVDRSAARAALAPLASHPVQVEGLLAAALGAEETDFKTVMAVALQNADARLRADALRVGLGVLGDEPDLNDTVTKTLDAFDDAALADWLRVIAPEYAEEVARRTARTARLGPLRRRAAAVARILRSSGSAN